MNRKKPRKEEERRVAIVDGNGYPVYATRAQCERHLVRCAKFIRNCKLVVVPSIAGIVIAVPSFCYFGDRADWRMFTYAMALFAASGVAGVIALFGGMEAQAQYDMTSDTLERWQ